MSGLVDSDTGLAFGDSLVWMDAIGGPGFTIITVTIDAPTLTLFSSPGDDPPELTVAFDDTVIDGDVVVLQYASNPAFIGAVEVTHTLDASDILAGEVNMTTPMLGDGVWRFRARITRGGIDSPWSNVVTDTIGIGLTGQPIGLLLALTYTT